MNKYIKPETKVVEVKIESLLNDASFGGAGGSVSVGGSKQPGNPWEEGAGKNHQPGYPWDELWEDPEEGEK